VTCWKLFALWAIITLPIALAWGTAMAWALDPPVSILASVVGGLTIGYVSTIVTELLRYDICL
jgi:uncharacterized membrane protein